jgi:hypothetical protein
MPRGHVCARTECSAGVFEFENSRLHSSSLYSYKPYTARSVFVIQSYGAADSVQRVPLRYGLSDGKTSIGTLGPGKWHQEAKGVVGRLRRQWDQLVISIRV